MSMSIKEQENVKRFLKYYSTTIALILSILCGFLTFYINNETLEYPEEEYQKIDLILEQVLDINNKSIHYDIEVPANMKLSFYEAYGKPSVMITSTYKKGVSISSYTDFNTTGELVFRREYRNKEDLNNHYKNIDILFSFLIGSACFLIEMLLFIPIKKCVILIGTRDEYKAVKNSYLRAGKNAKIL